MICRVHFFTTLKRDASAQTISELNWNVFAEKRYHVGSRRMIKCIGLVHQRHQGHAQIQTALSLEYHLTITMNNGWRVGTSSLYLGVPYRRKALLCLLVTSKYPHTWSTNNIHSTTFTAVTPPHVLFSPLSQFVLTSCFQKSVWPYNAQTT